MASKDDKQVFAPCHGGTELYPATIIERNETYTLLKWAGGGTDLVKNEFVQTKPQKRKHTPPSRYDPSVQSRPCKRKSIEATPNIDMSHASKQPDSLYAFRETTDDDQQHSDSKDDEYHQKFIDAIAPYVEAPSNSTGSNCSAAPDDPSPKDNALAGYPNQISITSETSLKQKMISETMKRCIGSQTITTQSNKKVAVPTHVRKDVREQDKTNKMCLDNGFDKCLKGKGDPQSQKELDGTFFIWQWQLHGIIQPDKTSKITEISTDFSNIKADHLHFLLYLNTSFGSTRTPTWQPWLALTCEVDLPDYKELTLTAMRDFNKGDTVGVYMDLMPSKHTKTSNNAQRPYLPDNVSDALEGLSSGKPALLGMHFLINVAPSNITDSASDVNCEANVKLMEDGRAVATQRIFHGETLLGQNHH